MFLVNLVVELADENKPNSSRQMAGILLKNTLTSKDENKFKQLKIQWQNLDEEIKKKVEVQILNTLHSSSKEARRISALVNFK